MTKVEYYELFLREFEKQEFEKQELILKLRRGRNVWPIAQRLAELEIRTNELERIFLLLKGWF